MGLDIYCYNIFGFLYALVTRAKYIPETCSDETFIRKARGWDIPTANSTNIFNKAMGRVKYYT